MKPIGNLNNVEKFEHKSHIGMRIVFPNLLNAEIVAQNLSSPHQADNIKTQKLATFIEFSMFNLGQMEFAINSIQQIFLNYLVHNNSNQQVEKNGREILGASSVMNDILRYSRRYFHRNAGIEM